MIRKILISLIFTLIFICGLFAKSITIACFQNESVDELCKSVTQEFDDSLFEPFFDAGFIATNIPITESNSKKERAFDILAEKLEEPTDYILVAYLEYEKELEYNEKLDKKIPIWKKLSVSLVNLDSKKELLNNKINLDKINELDPQKKAQKISVEVATKIINFIRQGKGA